MKCSVGYLELTPSHTPSFTAHGCLNVSLLFSAHRCSSRCVQSVTVWPRSSRDPSGDGGVRLLWHVGIGGTCWLPPDSLSQAERLKDASLFHWPWCPCNWEGHPGLWRSPDSISIPARSPFTKVTQVADKHLDEYQRIWFSGNPKRWLPCTLVDCT